MEDGLRYRPDILRDVPPDLVTTLKELDDTLAIDRPQLKRITAHFVDELAKGLTVEGGDIPMNVTWVMGYPTGNEQGRFLTLDMGGTNLRVCEVCLSKEEREFELTQSKYKLPAHIKSASQEELWDFVAECLRLFLHEHHGGDQSANLPLAFTFSYPVTQLGIRSGILQRWTKDFNVPGVEGHDVIPQLEAAFKRKQLSVKVVALANDTTGTLMSTKYRNSRIKIGSIFSTGCNAAYMEECRAVPKIQDKGLPPDALVAINTEYGAFDNKRRILPRTRFDEDIDRMSARPNQQLYEKMVAGLYMGELIRLILLELHYTNRLFAGQDITRLQQRNVVDSSFLSIVEEDTSESLIDIRKLIREKLDLEPLPHELRVCRYLVELIGTRAARLYVCGIAAICKKRKIQDCHVGVDGTVFNQYTHFRKRAAQALRDILDWPEDREDLITFYCSEDGSGVGAALIAALALERSDNTE
ncbi:hypothetical protein MW887_005105 [Aspergillus wentii]|nr:hypothetical protein MW887_005105 [Aspergillus wentii]